MSLPPRQVLAIGLLVALATSLPYAWCWWRTPPDHAYLGLKAINGADHLSFAMWMAQARPGTFLMRDLYTAESTTPEIAVPFFWALGRLGHAAHLSPFLVLHLGRAAFAVALVAACSWFTGVFATGAERTRGFAMLALGSGLPGFIPEASPVSAAFDSALMAASWSLLLLALGLFHGGQRDAHRGRLLAGGACAGILAVIHPYDAVTCGAVALAATALGGYAHGAGARLAGLALWAAGALPGGAVALWQIVASETVRRWAGAPRPMLWWAWLSFGALWIGVAAAAFWCRGREHRFAWIWLAVGVTLVAIPSPFSRRLVQGLQAPMALLSAGAFQALIAAGRPRFPRLTEVTLYPAPILMLLLEPTGILMAPPPIPRPLVAELRSLATLPDGVILAGPDSIAPLIPPLAARTVHCGHYDLTLDAARKWGDYDRLLAGSLGAEDLRRAGIAFVVVPSGTDLASTGLRLARQGATLRVFEVP